MSRYLLLVPLRFNRNDTHYPFSNSMLTFMKDAIKIEKNKQLKIQTCNLCMLTICLFQLLPFPFIQSIQRIYKGHTSIKDPKQVNNP